MAKIKQLSKEIAAMIAAGEVVERPASVVKELVENSIDAGATRITVEIRHGGVTQIRVTDDGIGIGAEDVPLAFSRHATSKIETGEDLENIATLGFRGEALYSIAAVSRVEIITRDRQSEIGVRAIAEAGKIVDVTPAGCPQGTTISVRDLFFNTPARMKFLKRDATEAGYVEDTLRKIALGRSDVSFRFINNGKEVFFTSGDGKLENTVAALYGRDFSDAMLPIEYEGDGVHVKGLIGKSELTRPNRTFQIFFVNGRTVMHKSFYTALAEAYKGQVMAGRFPVAVLSLSMHPALCDVNVHPAKLEIKFADDKPIFDAIYWGTKNTLYAIRDTRKLQVEAPKPIVPPAPVQTNMGELPRYKTETTEKKETVVPKKEWVVKPVLQTPPLPKVTEIEEGTGKFCVCEAETVAPPAPPMPSEIQKTPPSVRVIGQAFDTYIIAQSGDKLYMIDQHAAHERILYNALMEALSKKRVDSQLLLLPVTVRLTASEMAVFSEHSSLLAEIGFEAEEFGTGLVKIGMVPTALTDTDIGAAFLEILDNLAASKRDLRTSAQSYALYGVACKAALKAGKQLPLKEQEALVNAALALEGMATCPHGRPIILSLTQKEIEKQFKRIV